MFTAFDELLTGRLKLKAEPAEDCRTSLTLRRIRRGRCPGSYPQSVGGSEEVARVRLQESSLQEPEGEVSLISRKETSAVGAELTRSCFSSRKVKYEDIVLQLLKGFLLSTVLCKKRGVQLKKIHIL